MLASGIVESGGNESMSFFLGFFGLVRFDLEFDLELPAVAAVTMGAVAAIHALNESG